MLRRLSELIPINALAMSADFDVKPIIVDLANYIYVDDEPKENGVLIQFESNYIIANFTNLDTLENVLRNWLKSSEYCRKYSVSENKIVRIAPHLALAIRSIAVEFLQQLQVKQGITIEIKHVTERERLAYEIFKKIMSEFKIKTFYVKSSKEYIIDIYCYNGVVY